MALTDEVLARYGEQFIKNITNPQAPSFTTTDTTRLAAAAADATADFPIYANVDYDGTLTTHVAVAVDGVIAYLRKRTAQGVAAADEQIEKYHERLRDLAKITGRNRIAGRTSASTTETPVFDRDKFNDVFVRGPRSADDDDDPARME